MARHRGDGDQCCPACGQWFNAVGQRLRPDWIANPSLGNEDLDDLEGFERAALARESA
ncbi:hypothetical protein [Granulicoccus phenolivorans]|uniref:hypothetical protein n=1 Tax=Granulicoccus phenolivorans TaxID=266854 RepID=UPI00041BA699|nr:hypothetical protein [Granulicoccus phenolivorans]